MFLEVLEITEMGVSLRVLRGSEELGRKKDKDVAMTVSAGASL